MVKILQGSCTLLTRYFTTKYWPVQCNLLEILGERIIEDTDFTTIYKKFIEIPYFLNSSLLRLNCKIMNTKR